MTKDIKKMSKKNTEEYEKLLVLTEHLLLAVEENEWDNFLVVEIERKKLIKEIEHRKEVPDKGNESLIQKRFN